MKEYSFRKQINSSRKDNDPAAGGKAESIPNSAMEAIMAGRAHADAAMLGHREDLAPSLAAKMSKAFGMDLSRMQLYRSEAMQGTGTEGLASGNRIVLSKDIDLNTTAGQAVLGHEISHVHAQNQGIGMGNTGFYQNAGLEHQADVEGMRAAHGQSILGESSGMDTGMGMAGLSGLAPIGAGMSASAGAPMQAKKAQEYDSHYKIPWGERHGYKLAYLNADSFRRKADKSEETGIDQDGNVFINRTPEFVNQIYEETGKTAKMRRHQAYKDQVIDTINRPKAYGMKKMKKYQKEAAQGKNSMYNLEQYYDGLNDREQEFEEEKDLLHDWEMGNEREEREKMKKEWEEANKG